MTIRLNKFLAQAGVTSRRDADKLIESGRVTVNGDVINVLGTKIDVNHDRVELDGKQVVLQPRLVYLLLNKPAGYLVTLRDPYQRPTVMDLLPSLEERVFPIGRLDFESEGLLLLSNDGELSNRLIHPRYQIKKQYRIKIKGRPEAQKIKRLEKGIYLDNRKTAPARISQFKPSHKHSWLHIEIHEGRKREIRRMFQAVGHPVMVLKRIKFAGLTLGRLKPGEWRYLTQSEVARLHSLVNL